MSTKNVTDYPTVNFVGDCGESTDASNPYHATAADPGAAPYDNITINGKPIDQCIIGNDGAKVFNIEVVNNDGYYSYCINVTAQGPSGWGSGSLYLAFTDESEDTYYLSIYDSSVLTHTLKYNSGSPNIKEIWWCDYSFTVPSQKKTKADFSVTSPAR